MKSQKVENTEARLEEELLSSVLPEGISWYRGPNGKLLFLSADAGNNPDDGIWCQMKAKLPDRRVLARTIEITECLEKMETLKPLLERELAILQEDLKAPDKFFEA